MMTITQSALLKCSCTRRAVDNLLLHLVIIATAQNKHLQMFILETPLNACIPVEWEKKKSIPPQAEGQQSHYAACYSVIKVRANSKPHVIWF